MLEETNYYPFDLTMAGISSQSAGKPENHLKYNGKVLQHQEFNTGIGLEEYDYGSRMQDPQLVDGGYRIQKQIKCGDSALRRMPLITLSDSSAQTAWDRMMSFSMVPKSRRR